LAFDATKSETKTKSADKSGVSKALIPQKKVHSGFERRAERRLLCSNLVQVSWTAADGARHTEFGVLEDLSSSGLGLSMHFDVPPECGTELSILANRQRFTGRVVQCTYRADGYLVGLEMDEPCEQVDGLEHVLDLTLLDLG
jgi:hypothetical protein